MILYRKKQVEEVLTKNEEERLGIIESKRENFNKRCRWAQILLLDLLNVSKTFSKGMDSFSNIRINKKHMLAYNMSAQGLAVRLVWLLTNI